MLNQDNLDLIGHLLFKEFIYLKGLHCLLLWIYQKYPSVRLSIQSRLSLQSAYIQVGSTLDRSLVSLN